jgi:hypothetical protein
LNVKVAFDAADGHASLPHDVVVGAEQEMDFPSGATEHGAVIAPHRPATDNGNFHFGLEGRRAGATDFKDGNRPALPLMES